MWLLTVCAIAAFLILLERSRKGVDSSQAFQCRFDVADRTSAREFCGILVRHSASLKPGKFQIRESGDSSEVQFSFRSSADVARLVFREVQALSGVRNPVLVVVTDPMTDVMVAQVIPFPSKELDKAA